VARRLAERKRIWEEEGLPRRAEGGDVEEDQPYIVGERGPEVFVPERKGSIMPNLSDLASSMRGPGVSMSREDEVALAGKG
jgi:hypothetical protein